MILRRKFFKKVLIGSIFTLQLTVTGSVYNALAVGPATDKIPTKDSIQSNVEIDKDVKKVENGAAYQSKDDLERYYTNLRKKYWKDISNIEEELKSNEEKLQKINLDLTDDKIKEEEKQALQEELNIIKQLNEKLIDNITETSEKIKKLMDERYEVFNTTTKAEEVRKAESDKKSKEDLKKHYTTLMEKYYNDISDKQLKFRSNQEKLRKISLYLISDNIIEEKSQSLQEELKNIREDNKKITYDVRELLEKIEKVKIEKHKIAAEVRKTEEAKKSKEDEIEYRTEMVVN